MKRLNTPKAVFTYTVGDDPTVYGEDDLHLHPHMQTYYENWVEGRKENEREWRNYELTNSDWMLISDATFNGELIDGSAYLDEIKQYRTELRAYNLTTDDRPTRPEWFK